MDTALAAQERITAFATETGRSQLAVETELKKRVRHPEPESDAA